MWEGKLENGKGGGGDSRVVSVVEVDEEVVVAVANIKSLAHAWCIH